jgi:transketolase
LRKHFLKRITERARIDSAVFLIVGDLGYSVIEDFQREFPSRFANIGVSEQAGMGIAAGLSRSHLPIFYSIANFSSFRCLEQIRNDVAHEGNPVMIVSLGAGFAYGTAGYSHHAIEDASAVASIFGMSVYTPACIHELDHILSTYWTNPRPLYIRLGSTESCEVCLPNLLALQDSEKFALSNSNSEVLFLTHGEIGSLVNQALKTSQLPSHQLSMPGFNISSQSELDLIASFRSVVTVEEHSREFGFGARVRSSLANNNFVSFEVMGVPNLNFHIGGSRQFHLKRSGLALEDFLASLERAHNA